MHFRFLHSDFNNNLKIHKIFPSPANYKSLHFAKFRRESFFKSCRKILKVANWFPKFFKTLFHLFQNFVPKGLVFRF